MLPSTLAARSRRNALIALTALRRQARDREQAETALRDLAVRQERLIIGPSPTDQPVPTSQA